MLDGAPVAPLSDPPELHGSLGNKASGPKTKGKGTVSTSILIYSLRKDMAWFLMSMPVITKEFRPKLKVFQVYYEHFHKLFDKFFESVAFFCVIVSSGSQFNEDVIAKDAATGHFYTI